MNHVLAACNTGSWQQKWACGWHQPNTAAYNAGYAFGHSVLPWLICAAVVVFIFARGRRGHRQAMTPAPGRK